MQPIHHIHNLPQVIATSYFIVQLREDFANLVFNAFRVVTVQFLKIGQVGKQLLVYKPYQIGTRHFQVVAAFTGFIRWFGPGVPPVFCSQYRRIGIALQFGFIGLILLQGIQVPEKEDPGGLLYIINLRVCPRIFEKQIVYIFKSLCVVAHRVP